MPASSRTRIAGWLGDSLKIRVTAKPEKGKANEAVSAVLAEALAIPKSEISLSSGRLRFNREVQRLVIRECRGRPHVVSNSQGTCVVDD